jgi:hypothetical protein
MRLAELVTVQDDPFWGAGVIKYRQKRIIETQSGVN